MTTVTMDNEGRIVLPQDLRDGLDLKPGDELVIEWEGDLATVETLEAFILRRGREGERAFRAGGLKTIEELAAEYDVDLNAVDDDLVIL